VIGFVLGTIRARQRELKADRLVGPSDLAAAAFVLHEIIRKLARLDDGDEGVLRLTIHRVDWTDPMCPKIQQAIPYVGDKHGGVAGREFSTKSGIIGRVVRECRVFTANRVHEDYPKYLSELAVEWNYTPAEARKLRPDRYSWMGVPIIDQSDSNRRAVGVLYVDSSVTGIFSRENIQKVAIVGAMGLARFVRERYG
jgi:hypothetical protein